MKKHEVSSKKKINSGPIQSKLSPYLIRSSKEKDTEDADIVCISSTIDEMARKRRKISEYVECSVHHPLAKSTAIVKPCSSQSVQLERDSFTKESALMPIVFHKSSSNKISVDSKNVHSVVKTMAKTDDYKENVMIDLTGEESDSNDVILITNNIMLDECSLIEEHKLSTDHETSKEVLNLSNDYSEFFDDDSFNSELNFENIQRCKVLDVREEYNHVSLTVTHFHQQAETYVIKCTGFWKCVSSISKTDIVAIQASKIENEWVVDNNAGFIIIHPDILISGTTVVSALFCPRRAVLIDKFKKIESLPHFKGNVLPMSIGCLAHSLLQKTMSENIKQLSDVTSVMENMLKSKDTLSILYSADISIETCRTELAKFVPKIFEFIQHYLKHNEQKSIKDIKDNFQGKITDIRDIEENIWLPNLGLKGKIDITAEVNINSKRKIVPLEIKSGKPTFSFEHKGQIILYIMMMALTGQETDTGLLLYLRENIMQEITSRHHEKRDLILLRNTIARYLELNRPTETDAVPSGSGTQWKPLELPEPINHPTACNRCPYNALCCAYLKKEKEQLSEYHPLMRLSKIILDNFKPSHIDYIMQWVSLLQIEEAAQNTEVPLSRLWTLSPEERELKKTCISYLKILGAVKELNSRYRHTLTRNNAYAKFADTEIPYAEFSENEYVLLSTNTRVNISAGTILSITKNLVIILFDRDVSKYNVTEPLHLDKYSSSTLLSANLANVGGLMSNNEICTKLRNIIIDRNPATFDNGITTAMVHKSSKILKDLNENQMKAVLKVLNANDYMLIKGMPGTGKTQTLIALIELLYETGNSVLITSHTNSAVDNILLKLLDKRIEFLRLGTSAVHPLLKSNSEKFLTNKCTSLEAIEKMYSKNIIGVTCYGAHHPLIGKRMFDVCLVDESTQILQPTVIRPLYNAKKFVLVGDPDQLPPIVKSAKARKLGADESLFARLDSENNTVVLTEQYRMNKYIMDLANKLTYNDKLVAGNKSVEDSTILVSNTRILAKQRKWVQKALSQNIIDSVILINTGCTSKLKANQKITDRYKESDQVYSNIWEAGITFRIVQTLMEMDVSALDIGIIAPYKAHVNLLKKVIQKNVEINTVDQYQGRDKKIIIYSCARSLIKNTNVNENLEVLSDQRRLTVAITRAKSKLIIIGDKCTLLQYSTFKKLFELIQDTNTINLNNEQEDFTWDSIIDML